MSAQSDLKLQLMQAIRDWVRSQHLTQERAAQRLGIEQPVVSDILKLQCRYAPGWLLDAWVKTGGLWHLTLHHPDLIDSEAAPHLTRSVFNFSQQKEQT